MARFGVHSLLTPFKKTGKLRPTFDCNQRPFYSLKARLLYGSGLRLMECVRLRIKDIDFHYKTITVRNGKGGKDRVTMSLDLVLDDLELQLVKTKELYAVDRQAGHGFVYLPFALERKYPNAKLQ
jgi:integrase